MGLKRLRVLGKMQQLYIITNTINNIIIKVNKMAFWCLDKTDKFDVIFSYSVFTHTSFKEFEYIFNRHKEHLNAEVL